MNFEFRFHIIVEGVGGRNALSFYEIQLDALTIWACYPLPIHQMRTVPTPPYGCGKTPELAFKDLYLKINPVMIEEIDVENGVLSASVLCKLNAG